MGDLAWTHRTVSASIAIPRESLETIYGKVRRGHTIFYRKYPRPIKGGMTLADIVAERIARLSCETQAKFKEKCFKHRKHK